MKCPKNPLMCYVWWLGIMFKRLSSMLLKCLQTSRLLKPLSCMLLKCLKSSHQDPSMRTSMCGTTLVRRWSSRSPSHIRAGSPAWPDCQQTSWPLSGMIMQSWLGISLARLWSDDGRWWLWWWWLRFEVMDDDDDDDDECYRQWWRRFEVMMDNGKFFR